ncbi:MAG: Small, acid-soluble spore protein alpha/beta type [Haloplasmataceae bacterium]|jgi:hypothetical protein|nr:Small, acid-soluble spore protein alpha/beta type [Haloplasmataceae bacterium]
MNLNNNEQYQDIKEYLKQKENIKKAMSNLKNEVASEMRYDQISLPYGDGDTTSRQIGINAGPVGGVIVKDLIALGEQKLVEKYKNK